MLARKAWLGIALASALVVGGHAVTFLIAARTARSTAPPSQMLPIALVVMLWVATAVVYGIMVLAASLPGAAVLVMAWFRRIRTPERTTRPFRQGAAHA